VPHIRDYRCDTCEFSLPSGWGGFMYVVDDDGERVTCPHPGEQFTVERVLGEDADEATREERTGFNAYCVCRDCLARFELDVERDPVRCPDCGSDVVETANGIVDEPCPNCETGTVVEEFTGALV